MALKYELQVYREDPSSMLGVGDINEGKYVVIKGDHIPGTFDGYEAALEAGYDKFGLVEFLVRKIERNQTVMSLSRGLR